MKPTFTEPAVIDGDLDTCVTVSVAANATIFQVMGHIGATMEERSSFQREREEEIKASREARGLRYREPTRYRDDTYYNVHRTEDRLALIFNFQHGCTCEHDCCGCCFAHTVRVQKVQGVGFVLTSSSSRNY